MLPGWMEPLLIPYNQCSVEQNVVIVAACIPTLRPFFNRRFKARRSRQSSIKMPNHNNSGQNPESRPDSVATSRSVFRSRTDKRESVDSELPLHDVAGSLETNEPNDAESRNGDFNKGILCTVDVSMEWNNNDGEGSTQTDSVIPLSLRSINDRA